jgi:hypothetical protein
VGWRNYPYFVRFLGYMWAGCMFVAILTAAPFLESLEAPSTVRTATVGTAVTNAGVARLLLVGEQRHPLDESEAVTAALLASSAASARRSHSSVWDAEARLTLCFIICIAVGFAVSALFAWHVYLVSSNQTSIEYLGNRVSASRMQHRGLVFRNPYDLGWKRNWEAVFGTGPWYTWLLPKYSLPPGDGRTFIAY